VTAKPEHYYGFRLWTNCGIQVVYVSQSINQVREALSKSLVEYADIVEQVLAGHVHATNLDDAIPAFEDGNLIDDKLPPVERHPMMVHVVHPQKPFLHITRLLK
jgi:hypothetical protein